MTTAREVVTRTLRRLGVVDAISDPSAEDAARTLAALNEMIAGWADSGVETLAPEFVLDDTFAFFVPPKLLGGNTMEVLSLAGSWNASTNSPALASGSGTEGTVYRVSVAGATALDAVASWSVADYAVLGKTFSATLSPTLTWQKGLSANQHRGAVVALLGMYVCDDYGIKPSPVLVAAADDGWRSLLSQYLKTPVAEFDPALTRLPSRRWPYTVPSAD